MNDSEITISVNVELSRIIENVREYAESESRRFFDLQLNSSVELDKANYRGQYAMAQRVLNVLARRR